jgi:hypothetical protein
LYHIASNTAEVVWSIQFGFSIDFIRISPFDTMLILVADMNGKYSRIHGRQTSYDRVGSSLQTRNLVDVAFHPFLSDAIIFVFEFALLLLFSESRNIAPISTDRHSADPLPTAAFPDASCERAVLLVYQTHATCLRPGERNDNAHIKFFSAAKPDPELAQAAVCHRGALYVLGADSALQMFQLRGRSFWAMRIARALPSKPQDFLPIDSTLFFGCKLGILALIRSDSSVANYYKLCNTSIHQVVSVSEQLVIASTIVAHHPKVFLVNLASHTVKSLLKQPLESLSASSVQLSISVSREFVTVLIDTSILTIYHIHNDEAELLKIDRGVPSTDIFNLFQAAIS